MFRRKTICVANKRVTIQEVTMGTEIELSQADLNLASSIYIYLHLRQNKTAQLVGDLGPLKSYGFHLIGKEQIHLGKDAGYKWPFLCGVLCPPILPSPGKKTFTVVYALIMFKSTCETTLPMNQRIKQSMKFATVKLHSNRLPQSCKAYRLPRHVDWHFRNNHRPDNSVQHSLTTLGNWCKV